MVAVADPVVVVLGRDATALALADVVIVPARRGWCTGVAVASLHARYPGLTLVVVLGRGAVVAGFRDGTRLVLPGRASPGYGVRVARRLYRWWVAERSPAPSGGTGSPGSAPSRAARSSARFEPRPR